MNRALIKLKAVNISAFFRAWYLEGMNGESIIVKRANDVQFVGVFIYYKLGDFYTESFLKNNAYNLGFEIVKIETL